MKRSSLGRILPWAVFAAFALVAYFVNVEVQSYLGRQALENTGLVSLPFEQALAKARVEKKLVLVDVSAIWCSTCRKLDNEVFAKDQVKRAVNEKYVFSRLEYESDEGQQFLKKYEVSGFPTLWLLDENGKIIRRLRGTFDENEFIAQIK